MVSPGTNSPHPLQLPPFTLDIARGELRRGDTRVELEPGSHDGCPRRRRRGLSGHGRSGLDPVRQSLDSPPRGGA